MNSELFLVSAKPIWTASLTAFENGLGIDLGKTHLG